MTEYTFINERSGQQVTTSLTLSELANQFAQHANEKHWAWFWIAKLVNESQNGSNQQRKDMIAFLSDSFLYAIGMGLKRPMIRMQVNNRRYKIYLSKRGTLCFKSGKVMPGTSDPVGDEEYVGCLFNGKFLPNKARDVLTEEQVVLDNLSIDPVGFLFKTSKDMDRCCYCNLPLEDKRSKDVGYGPICAGRWGLPWGEKDYKENVPSFAKLWASADISNKNNIRMICESIRGDAWNSDLWKILGDVLEEAGFDPNRKPNVPERGITIPAS
jgi:hypothetical protein